MSIPLLAVVASALLALGQPCLAHTVDDASPCQARRDGATRAGIAGPVTTSSAGAGDGPVAAAEDDANPPPAPPRTAVNRASAEDLERLPGIGPRKASALVEARSLRPFKRPSDLRRVKGLGPKTIQRLAPLLTFD